MQELKSCPFCGGKAEYQQFASPKHYCRVICTKCGCCTDELRLNGEDESLNKLANATVWNNRPSEWISVEKRLPNKSGYYLCWFTDGFHGIYESGEETSKELWRDVTHWMYLPEPPRGAEDG